MPGDEASQTMVYLYSGAIWSIGLLCWSILVRRRVLGMPLVPCEEPPGVPWNLLHIVMICLVYLGWLEAVNAILPTQPESAPSTASAGKSPAIPDRKQKAATEPKPGTESETEFTLDARSLWLDGLSKLAGVACAILILRARAGATWRDMGLSLHQLAADARLGCWSFGLIAAPVFTIQAILTRWLESKHPLVESLQQNSTMSFLVLCSASAILVAPLCEEFLFRVILQGWFQSLETRLRHAFARGNHASTVDASPGDAPAWQAPRVASFVARWHRAVVRLPWGLPSLIASSLLFALAHLGNGPDPIPLFVLALALGFLYQRTGRLWPSVIVHMLLNTVSMSMLWFS